MTLKNIPTYIKILWEWKWAFLPSIYFNFRYLPFKQAIKLPIWINKPHLYAMKGKIIIDAPVIKTGMIHLGGYGGHMYPDNGIHITQWGGKIIFKGGCYINNNSFIVQGADSTIIFGEDFVASTSVKIISFKHIEFGAHVSVGWDVLFMDSNFHPLYDMEKQKFKRAYGPIKIGDYNWFASQCKVMHSVTTPERCIFGMGSVLTRGAKYESYCVHGGSPIRILSRNVMRVYGQDRITDYNEY